MTAVPASQGAQYAVNWSNGLILTYEQPERVGLERQRTSKNKSEVIFSERQFTLTCQDRTTTTGRVQTNSGNR